MVYESKPYRLSMLNRNANFIVIELLYMYDFAPVKLIDYKMYAKPNTHVKFDPNADKFHTGSSKIIAQKVAVTKPVFHRTHLLAGCQAKTRIQERKIKWRRI